MDIKQLQEFVVSSRKKMSLNGKNFGAAPPDTLALGLCSEAGEVASAVMREYLYGQPRKPDDDKSALPYELVDVLIYTLALANKCGINIEDALLNKMAMNMKRYGVEAVPNPAAEQPKAVQN